MKHILFFSFFMSIIYQASATQCGSLNLTTQAEVDGVTPCDTAAQITINGAGITSITNLTFIKHVTGTIFITNTNLTTLTGLENLTGAERVWIIGNGMLSDINALNNTKVTTQLQILNNSDLSQCCVFRAQLLANSIGSTNISNNGKAPTMCNTPDQIEADLSCEAMVEPVPTIGEWGLIILSQLFMVIGLVVIKGKRVALEMI